MKAFKLLAVVGLAVALIAMPTLAQQQQPTQPTVTINVQCSPPPQSRPSIAQNQQRVELKRGDTVQWQFDANLNSCAPNLATIRLTFAGTPPRTPLVGGTPPTNVPISSTTFTAGQVATIGPFTVASNAIGSYPYKIEFFAPGQTNPIQNTTINGQATVIQVTPTLTEWGLIALAVLLAGGMGYMLYRRPALRPAAP